jgi:integrase
MPRKPGVWFREQDGWFYTTFRGEQTKLAQALPNKKGVITEAAKRDARKEADKAFHALHAQEPGGEAGGFRPSFRNLADQYLTSTQQTKSAKTYEHQRYFLQSFCDHVHSKRVADVKPADVTAWLSRHPTWKHNSQVTARGILRACINWGLDQGILTSNPIQRVKTGSPHRRERILTTEERKKVREATSGREFKNYLFFLEQTGARPFSEAGQLTAEMIDFEEDTIIFVKHKNTRKGKKRVIYMTPALQEFLKKLCKERPTGYLFRTNRGQPFTNHNTTQRIRRLEEKVGLKRFSLNAYRKSYITDALEKGLSSDIVAELCGNTSKTISKYYNLLSEKKDALKAAAARAVG